MRLDSNLGAGACFSYALREASGRAFIRGLRLVVTPTVFSCPLGQVAYEKDSSHKLSALLRYKAYEAGWRYGHEKREPGLLYPGPLRAIPASSS